MNKLYMAGLQMTPGIGTARLHQLLRFFGSAEQVWRADLKDLCLSRCLDEQTCHIFLEHREKLDIEQLAEAWERASIKLCSLEEPEYPALLTCSFRPPQVLFYRGTLPEHDKLIGIVGARRASVYGKNAAERLAHDVAAAGFWVISGAARGIDTAAHRGALAAGKTVAVLGCGVDVVYPPENAALLDEIARAGCVISEYAPGTQPHAAFFPARNRIISGMSRGVVVVEAAEKSGALITADFALEEGRDVFAVPGSIFSAASQGAHRLIKQGAKLVERAADILEEYGQTDGQRKPDMPDLTAAEQAVYDSLTYDTLLTVEEIVIKTGMLPSTAAYIVLQLELRGLVAEHAGQRYARAAKEGIR